MVQSDNGGNGTLGNTLGRAELQLAVPSTIPADISYATNGLQLLQWNNDNATPNDVPGLSGPTDNIATEALGYIHLTAGGHRIYANSDDGWQLRSGRTPTDTAATVIGYRDGGTFSGTSDFIVEADGLYPARCIWYENGGGAHFELDSVNLSDNSHVLINDAGGPEVYVANYALTLYSSTTAGGPYTLDGTGVVDIGARTVTVPVSGSRMFYKLNGPSAVTITSTRKVGSTIVLTYQF